LKATAILPVKRFTEAKSRLAQPPMGRKRPLFGRNRPIGGDSTGIDGAGREELAEAMLGDALDAIGSARSIERTIVVTTEPRAAVAAEAVGAEVLSDFADESHSEAALAGVGRAEEHGASCVVLLPIDCPLLDPRELDRLLTGVPERYVAIVPDRHGTGTNALALAPPSAIRPAFGEESCARHVAAAREAGLPFSVEELPSLALDLDTPADVVALARALESNPGRARRTVRALGI
jgi:2-phospho-L-lactate guanylyltransferase